MAMPRTVSTTPVTSPTVRLFTRLANRADTRDAVVATTMHSSITSHFSKKIAGWIIMWLTDAIKAVNVIMKVLVPTAVFSSIPKKADRTISMVIPPPEPTNPVPKPIGMPQAKERMTSFRPSFVPFFTGFYFAESGFTRKRMPIQTVKIKVKPPKTTLPVKNAT